MDYRIYVLSVKEYILYGFLYLIGISILSYMFYYSPYPIIIFSPFIIVFFKYIRNTLKEKRDKKLTIQFKDFISIISSFLSTGYSLENAIIESKKELMSIHGDSMIVSEVDFMIKKLKLHIPPEDIFRDFAARTSIEHIQVFSEILSIAKKRGGDLIHIILSTSSSIASQIEINREIDISVSGRKYELYVMSIMPLLIMSYIKLTQPGFFNPVYGNLTGILVMSLCLLLYIAAILAGRRILSA